jgi:hypothetical protein
MNVRGLEATSRHRRLSWSVPRGPETLMTRAGIEPAAYGLKVKKAPSPSTESGGKTRTSQPTEGNEEV